MPSLRSIALVGLPLAASSFVTSNEDLIGQDDGVPESRRAASEQRYGIVAVSRDAIERVVESAREEFGFKRYLHKRQDSNSTSTTSEMVTSSVSLPVDSSSSSPSQGQFTTSSILASTSAAQDPVSTETPVSVSTTFSPVPATTTEQPPATSSEAPPTSSSEAPSTTPSIAPTSDPTSDAPSSSAAPSTAPSAQPSSTSLAVIDSAGSVVTSVPSVATLSNSNGQQVTLTSPTPGRVYTNTASNGNVAIVTYTPDGGTVSEVRFITTTLPNGSQTVRTSYATVGAPASPTGGSSNSNGGSGNAPQLQSGAAIASTWYAAEVAVLLAAGVGAAAALL